jgi:hypothetical protein
MGLNHRLNVGNLMADDDEEMAWMGPHAFVLRPPKRHLFPAVRVGAFAKVRLSRVLRVDFLPLGHSLVRDPEQRLVLRQALLTISGHPTESNRKPPLIRFPEPKAKEHKANRDAQEREGSVRIVDKPHNRGGHQSEPGPREDRR